MTLKKWKERAARLGLKMEWAIFKKDEVYCDKSASYEDWNLDLGAPDIPDGSYRCVYGNKDENPTEGMCVHIADGKFQSFRTAKALYDLVWPREGHYVGPHLVPSEKGDPVGHKYIEKLMWMPDQGCFRLRTGS